MVLPVAGPVSAEPSSRSWTGAGLRNLKICPFSGEIYNPSSAAATVAVADVVVVVVLASFGLFLTRGSVRSSWRSLCSLRVD